MTNENAQLSYLPPDNLARQLTVSEAEDDRLQHIGVVGDTYTTLLSGKDTGGSFCIVDMHIPPGGGPGPHRHDFEETFVVLEGEVEVTFRGERLLLLAGTTANIPANAPHRFENKSSSDARLLCIASPAGIEEFFAEIGVLVTTRTAKPPQLSGEQLQAFVAKAKSLGPKYRTELLKEA